MFFIYLNEGIKILFRMGYGFFKIYKYEIQKCTEKDQLFPRIVSGLANMKNVDKKVFIQICFQLKLNKIKDQFSAIEVEEDMPHAIHLYKPILDESSHAIPDETFELIYQWIPGIYRASDPKLIYANWRDGSSLKHLIKVCEDYEDIGWVMIIQARNGYCFGAFMSHGFRFTRGEIDGNSDFFMFSLSPEEKVFRSTGKNDNFYSCDNEYVYFGSGERGAALTINNEITKGRSSRSDTYDNDCLCDSKDKVDSDFAIRYFEVYALL